MSGYDASEQGRNDPHWTGDPVDEITQGLSLLQELADAKAVNERLARILSRYVAEHNRLSRCDCIWCLEAKAILD